MVERDTPPLDIPNDADQSDGARTPRMLQELGIKLNWGKEVPKKRLWHVFHHYSCVRFFFLSAERVLSSLQICIWSPDVDIFILLTGLSGLLRRFMVCGVTMLEIHQGSSFLKSPLKAPKGI